MTGTTETGSTVGSVRCLWAVRIACFVSVLTVSVIVANAILTTLRTPQPCPKPELGLGRLSILIPYLIVCFCARGEWLKRGLGMATVIGLVAFVLSANVLSIYAREQPSAVFRHTAGPIASFTLAQLVLVFAAFLGWRTLRKEPACWRQLGLFVAGVPLYLWIILNNTFPAELQGVAANEAVAVGTLSAINSAETVFRITYQSGFTDGLNRLGAPRKGSSPDKDNAGLLDDIRSGRVTGYRGTQVGGHGTNTSFVKAGYMFNYSPGPAGAEGLIDTYRIVGRPERYPATGCLSITSDESGLIRGTRENRTAMADDRPILSRL